MKNGWKIKSLGDVCHVIAGQSPEGKYYNSLGKGTPFYQGKKDFGEKFIEEQTTWTTEVTKIAKKGDILMSVRAPVGPINFATEEICIGRGLAAIRCKSELHHDFLFYQLLNLQAKITGNEGAVFNSINKGQIEALPFAFTPLPEQKRIVGILDEAFEGIAKAKENAEKNQQNAKELFESHSNEVFTNKGKGWSEKKLEDVCEVIAGQSPEGKFYNSEGKGMPFYQGKKDFGEKYIEAPSTWTTEVTKVAQNGDVLMSVRAPVGPINFANSEVCIGRGLAAIRCKPDMNQDFLFYQLLHLQPEIAGNEGAVFNSINKSQIEALPILFSNLSEQKKIVGILDLLCSETQHFEAIYQQKSTAFDELKKSILHQAFSGQL